MNSKRSNFCCGVYELFFNWSDNKAEVENYLKTRLEQGLKHTGVNKYKQPAFYFCILTNRQKSHLHGTLLSFGFKLVDSNKNENTNSCIYFYLLNTKKLQFKGKKKRKQEGLTNFRSYTW